MSNHLEKFIQNNRDAFDDEVPDPKILERIHQQMNPPASGKAKVIPIGFKRGLSAAAIIILIAGATLYFILHHKPSVTIPGIVSNNLPKPADTAKTENMTALQPEKNISKIPAQTTNPDRDDKSSAADDYAEEMVHYTRLIEIKHHELKRLEKDEPLLYKQFAGDVNKLDSVYKTLETQLPKNSNREQLIEAMIQNLQLQIGLLNRQLKIIKQINHSKKSAYENAYKSV